MIRFAPLLLAAGFALGCASAPGPERYRLGDADGWELGHEESVPADLLDRYPDFFAIVLDVDSDREPDLLMLRDDLERRPVSIANYDALNAVGIAYFLMNDRAESERGGPDYLRDSFKAARLVAVPWRAYGATEDAMLRGAILDFFEDVADGEKRGSAGTASRLARVVSSLEKKESDTARLERIRLIVLRLSSRLPPS